MASEIAISISSNEKSFFAWDIRTGTVFSSFRNSSGLPNTIVSVPFPAQGPLSSALLLVAQPDSALLNVHTWSKHQPLFKSVLPEKLSSLACSPDGVYCIGGGISGRIYIWNMSTGKMIKMFDAHIDKIMDIQFTLDGLCFVSAGFDSSVRSWRIGDVITQTNPKPFRTYSGHRLPVTALHCGFGLSSASRLYSVSLDRTCKIWDFNSGECLVTISLPSQATSITVPPSESDIILGTDSGVIHKISIDEPTDASKTFKGHTMRINSLSLSFDGSLLVSGSDDGKCIVWDVESMVSMRIVEQHKAPVSHVSIYLKPIHIADPDFPKTKLPVTQPFEKFPSAVELINVNASKPIDIHDIPACFNE